MAVRASQGRSYSNRKVDQESLPGSDVPLVPNVRLDEFSRFWAAKRLLQGNSLTDCVRSTGRT